MPSILSKLELAQNRIAALQDILQDTLYHAQATHLLPCNAHDLTRALRAAESIFNNLAAIRARLAKTHPHLNP